MEVKDLGVIDYNDAYRIQMSCHNECQKGEGQFLIVCEHHPVLTFGRMSRREHLLVTEDYLKRQRIQCRSVDRGGDVTMHAPGQLVAYPILNLNLYKKDLHYYLNQLEEVIIELLGNFDIIASRSERNTGVWYNNKKIASIGIGVKQWISYHGIAININTNLNLFSLIKPCGMDVHMTSMADILGQRQDFNLVKKAFIRNFNKHFDITS